MNSIQDSPFVRRYVHWVTMPPLQSSPLYAQVQSSGARINLFAAPSQFLASISAQQLSPITAVITSWFVRSSLF